jgi:hypothetical protein
MKKINLFIVGTQKGGTTALADFLSKHPEIYVTDGKESHVFDDPALQGATSEAIDIVYQRYLSRYQGEAICCDATPIYMYFKEIPARLSSYNPDARVIIILRDPAERAFSQYQMEKRRGDEKLGYAEALFAETRRLAADINCYQQGSAHRLFSYRSRGHYSKQLQNVFSVFPREQVLLLTNDELRHDHEITLEKVTHFLNIEQMKIASATVFSGDYQATLKEHIANKLLRLYFFPEKVRLRLHYGLRL